MRAASDRARHVARFDRGHTVAYVRNMFPENNTMDPIDSKYLLLLHIEVWNIGYCSSVHVVEVFMEFV